MVKFALNFCYCAVDQEKAVFQCIRAVSGPSGLLGPEMVKFASNFCYCFSLETDRFWPIWPFGARSGKICFEFLLLCCRPRKSRFSMETGRFWPIWPLGLEVVTFGSNFCSCAVDQEKAAFQAVSGPSICPLGRPQWANLLRISAIVL